MPSLSINERPRIQRSAAYSDQIDNSDAIKSIFGGDGGWGAPAPVEPVTKSLREKTIIDNNNMMMTTTAPPMASGAVSRTPENQHSVPLEHVRRQLDAEDESQIPQVTRMGAPVQVSSTNMPNNDPSPAPRITTYDDGPIYATNEAPTESVFNMAADDGHGVEPVPPRNRAQRVPEQTEQYSRYNERAQEGSPELELAATSQHFPVTAGSPDCRRAMEDCEDDNFNPYLMQQPGPSVEGTTVLQAHDDDFRGKNTSLKKQQKGGAKNAPQKGSRNNTTKGAKGSGKSRIPLARTNSRNLEAAAASKESSGKFQRTTTRHPTAPSMLTRDPKHYQKATRNAADNIDLEPDDDNPYMNYNNHTMNNAAIESNFEDASHNTMTLLNNSMEARRKSASKKPPAPQMTFAFGRSVPLKDAVISQKKVYAVQHAQDPAPLVRRSSRRAATLPTANSQANSENIVNGYDLSKILDGPTSSSSRGGVAMAKSKIDNAMPASMVRRSSNATTTTTNTGVESSSSKEAAGPGASSEKLSKQRFDGTKKAEPWGGKKLRSASSFAQEYQRGTLPCRVKHMGSRNEIQWNVAFEHLKPYCWDLLLLSSQGLVEVEHPLDLLAAKSFADLCKHCLQSVDQGYLRKTVQHIRAALMAKHPQNIPFKAGLLAIKSLAEALKEDVVPALPSLMMPIGHQLQTNPKLRACANSNNNRDSKTKGEIERALSSISQHGGDMAYSIVKSKIPSFAY